MRVVHEHAAGTGGTYRAVFLEVRHVLAEGSDSRTVALDGGPLLPKGILQLDLRTDKGVVIVQRPTVPLIEAEPRAERWSVVLTGGLRVGRARNGKDRANRKKCQAWLSSHHGSTLFPPGMTHT